MEVSSFQGTYINISLNKVIQNLSEGLRANIPYSDTQPFSSARVTATLINGDNTDLFDASINNTDTVGIILEIENGIRGVLEPNFNPDEEHGGGVVAVYSI
jgi:hypothetical protein